MTRVQVVDPRLTPNQYAPNVQARTTGASPRQQVAFTTLGALGIVFLANMKKIGKAEARLSILMIVRGIVGWFVLFLTLAIASDFEATAPLATAFGWVILLTVLLVKGPAAVDTLAKAIPSEASK